MIDQIFEMIMREARTRHGPDLVSNIATVYGEVSSKIMEAMAQIREEERREKTDENKG